MTVTIHEEMAGGCLSVKARLRKTLQSTFRVIASTYLVDMYLLSSFDAYRFMREETDATRGRETKGFLMILVALDFGTDLTSNIMGETMDETSIVPIQYLTCVLRTE